MKKVISIILALALVASLLIPMTVNAEDNSVKLTITEDYEINWFHHPGIRSHEKVQKDGKWAFKYTAHSDEGDPYYALPFDYSGRTGFLAEINGDYHYAVMDIFYDAKEGNDTYVSFRLNHAQAADGNVWTQRHIYNAIETGKWTKVILDMTGTTDALGTPEVWSASGNGTAYADGEAINDSRIYFAFNSDVSKFDGNEVYFHELAFFKTKAEAEAYAAPEQPKTEEPADPNAAPALDSHIVWNCDANPDSVGPWLNDNAGRTIAAVFNVDKGFNEILLHVFFGSNPPQFGDANYNLKVALYKFSYNYANSIAGTPVASAGLIDVAGDNYCTVPSFNVEGTNMTLKGANNGLQCVLGSELPAGQYVLVFTSDGPSGSYNVLPKIGENLVDCNKFFRGTEPTDAFRFGINTNGQFVALIADSEVPAEAPQTGDATVAMFAVIAVVALAAVVVFKKRVVSR